MVSAAVAERWMEDGMWKGEGSAAPGWAYCVAPGWAYLRQFCIRSPRDVGRGRREWEVDAHKGLVFAPAFGGLLRDAIGSTMYWEIHRAVIWLIIGILENFGFWKILDFWKNGKIVSLVFTTINNITY